MSDIQRSARDGWYFMHGTGWFLLESKYVAALAAQATAVRDTALREALAAANEYDAVFTAAAIQRLIDGGDTR